MNSAVMTSLRDSVFYSNNSRWPRSQEIGYEAGGVEINVSRHARGWREFQMAEELTFK